MGNPLSMGLFNGPQGSPFASQTGSKRGGPSADFPSLSLINGGQNNMMPEFGGDMMIKKMMKQAMQGMNDPFAPVEEEDEAGGVGEDDGADGADGADGKGSEKTQEALQYLLEHFDDLDQDGNDVLDPNEIQGAAGDGQAQEEGGGVGGSQGSSKEGGGVGKAGGKGKTEGVDPDALSEITDHMDELIFASVDPGNAAWFGLTRQDLNALIKEQKQGKSIAKIGKGLRQKIAKQRGVSSSPKGFANYVRNTQNEIGFF